METLIEILIRLISGLFENRPVRQPQRRPAPPGYQGTPPQPGRIEPPSRARITQQMPTARRPGRRPPPVPIAFARPILTKLAPEPTPAPPPPMAVVRAVSHQAITAPNTIPPQSAAAIRKWLTPATLKQQFLLTEILQPPLALRENRTNVDSPKDNDE